MKIVYAEMERLFFERKEKTALEIMQLLKTRRTYRRFMQEPVPDSVVSDILNAARYASSAANRQPLSYVVVRSPEMVKRIFPYTKWAGYFPEDSGRPKEGEEPVMYIAVIENLSINRNADTDAGLAIGNMTLAAWSHGVGSCIIGACDRAALGELFGLEEDQKLHTVVAFGYPSHSSFLVDAEGDEIRYFMDEEGDYLVPKRRLEDVVRYL